MHCADQIKIVLFPPSWILRLLVLRIFHSFSSSYSKFGKQKKKCWDRVLLGQPDLEITVSHRLSCNL